MSLTPTQGALPMLPLLIFVSLATAQTVLAQDIPAHPRELSFEALEFDPPVAGRHRHVLSNGVVVFVVEDHTLPLVSVSVTVRTGSYLEPDGKQGLASLTGSQMRAGGTAELSAAGFDDEVAFLAAEIGSSVGPTSGRAAFNSLTKDLDATLDLFFSMLRFPRFDQARLELAKSQSLQGMQRRNDSTGSIEGREWGRLMRGDTHFSTRLVTRPSVESITRDDLAAFHDRYYHPGVFIFSVSGDVTPDEILPKLEAHMVDWPVKTDPVVLVPTPKHELNPGIYTVDKPDVNQGRVSVGHLGSRRDNPDRYALLVMNDILGGGGFTSRLLTRIRSDEGLAYSASSRFGLGTYYDGLFRVSFQSRSETVARAVAIVLEEIGRIRDQQVTEVELRTSKASFIETFTRNFSRASSTASLFANDEYTGRDPEYLTHYRDRIGAVTGDDVARVARQYLNPDQLVILITGDISTIEEGDSDHPEFSLDRLTNGSIARIQLPDPFTMEYPMQPSSQP